MVRVLALKTALENWKFEDVAWALYLSFFLQIVRTVENGNSLALPIFE